MDILLEILYIVSLSFQIAGALILIVRYWCKSIDEQVKELDAKRNHFENETFICGQSVPSNREYVIEIKLNRFAFAFIACGYVCSIWGTSRNKYIETIAIIVVTSIIVFAGLEAAGYKFGKGKE